MDALSIAAIILGLVEASSNGVWNLSMVLADNKNHLTQIQPHLNKLQTAITLLQTISKHLPNNEVLPGVDLSVKMCMKSWEVILGIINEEIDHRRSKSKLWVSFRMDQFTKRLSREVDMFADSVASLRTFSQEARMEYMIMSIKKLEMVCQLGLQYQTQLMMGVEETKYDLLRDMSIIMDVLHRQTHSAHNVDLNDDRAPSDGDTRVAELLSQLKAGMGTSRNNSDKRQEDMDEVRENLERTLAQQKAFDSNHSDEFVYNISILSRKDGIQDAPSSTHCRATLDTGCHDNWVWTDIIRRAGLLGSIGATADTDAFKSFSGHAMEPQGQIKLTFFLAMANGSSQQTRTETFFVFDRLPVDLVLGKGFIAKQFKLVAKQALGLVKQGKFTQEEVRAIEISMTEQGAANAEISFLRRAARSSARETRRAQKAASRVTTWGTNTPFSGTSGMDTPRYLPTIPWTLTGHPSLMVPTSGLHINSIQASEASGPRDDDEVQESDMEAGPSGIA